MSHKDEVIKLLEDVPPESLSELLEFVHYLKYKSMKEMTAQKKKREKPRLWGALEGQVWISDDFNDPMDFVSEDEAKMLEELRAHKQSEAQGISA